MTSGEDGDGLTTPTRVRWPTIARTASSSQPAIRASAAAGTRNCAGPPVSSRPTAFSAGSSTVERSMKNTCSPLSREDANSMHRAGRPSRPARPASW